MKQKEYRGKKGSTLTAMFWKKKEGTTMQKGVTDE